MEPKGFHGKLAAVLSADVAGYSRLIEDDEEAIITSLESYSLKTTLRLNPLRSLTPISTTWLGPVSEIGSMTRQSCYGWRASSSTRTAFSLLWGLRQPMK
jgi:hypothetical protein